MKEGRSLEGRVTVVIGVGFRRARGLEPMRPEG